MGGKRLEGYNESCNEEVRKTVGAYVSSVKQIAKEHDLQILLLPVAHHAYRSEKNGKALGRAQRRERMVVWNDALRDECSMISDSSPENASRDSSLEQRVFLLDYEKGLRHADEKSPVGFVLDNAYNADYTHMNSAFLPLLEDALERCDCDLNLI